MPLSLEELDEMERECDAAEADQADDAARIDPDERPDLWDPPEIWINVVLVRQLISAARSAVPEGWRPTHRHIKRGTEYRVLGWGRAQCSPSGLLDNEHVVIYQGQDGALWARRGAEFHDGRFEALAASRPHDPPERPGEG